MLLSRALSNVTSVPVVGSKVEARRTKTSIVGDRQVLELLGLGSPSSISVDDETVAETVTYVVSEDCNRSQ